MCGIAGFVRPTRDLAPENLLLASRTLKHRGPDGDGFLFWSPDAPPVSDRSESPDFPHLRFRSPQTASFRPLVGFLHRRLAIVETKPLEDGHQPMANSDGSIWLTFNGEIYNYPALRSELEALGCRFRTRTDTEVLLQAYQVWGTECLTKFDGMWAFALLDTRRHTLFAATDRSGVKPFYFSHENGNFSFSSEIKAFRDLGFSLFPNEQTLSRFLTYGLSDETPATFFRGVQRLQAGTALVLDLASHQSRIWTWHNWTVDHRFEPHGGHQEADRISRVRSLLEEAVSLRLQADVPIGICLSGGLDSSAIAAAVADLEASSGLATSRKAFMARLPEGMAGDEYPFARQMAELAGLDLLTVSPEGADLEAHLEDMLYHLDEPPPGLNAFSQYAVFKRINQEGIRVSLDGQGADELFAGYPRHLEMAAWEYLRHGKIPYGSRHLAQAFWNEFRDRLSTGAALRLLRLAKPEYGIVRFEILEMAGPKGQRFSGLNEGLASEFSSRSLPFLLKAADRNAMRWSVESRMPFADFHPLIQAGFSIPGLAKVVHGERKYLLKKAVSPRVPDAIRFRRDKVGFAAPDRIWLRALLQSPRWKNLRSLPECIHPLVFERWRTAFIQDPRCADPGVLWRAFATQVWARLFFG